MPSNLIFTSLLLPQGDSLLNRVLSFGPKNVGPNLLLLSHTANVEIWPNLVPLNESCNKDNIYNNNFDNANGNNSNEYYSDIINKCNNDNNNSNNYNNTKNSSYSNDNSNSINGTHSDFTNFNSKHQVQCSVTLQVTYVHF